MKKLSYLITILSLIVILASCSDSTSTNPEDQHQNSQKEENHNTKEKKSSNNKENSTDAQQPFEALKPSEDAKPLKEKLSEKEQKQMPAPEAAGSKQARSIPAGQTLVNGAKDKSNGPLKNHRLVAYYGHPNSTEMGIVGEMEPEAMMKKLKEQAQVYSDADPSRPAVPTIELITTVAQRDPGPNGKYYRMTPEEDIEKYAKLAEKHNALLLLDVQLGKDSVMNQVKLIEKWLKRPYVHLAIDTEFHVGKGEVPGEDLGQVNGAEVQKAVEYLSKLVEKQDLPDKFILVHQFTDAALTNKKAIKPTENVEVALNFDGWGVSSDKHEGYRKYVREEATQYGGFKVFYKKDEPVMNPLEVIKLDPSPAIVNYQ
ncbi:hypothetical protein [Thalassobacillus pellis]|uniref:hypothetical protein n=1 Tax=Thalassobacillus pellis TaxID=748008 RepID=UPI00195FB12A|nr:hypothetical protein [Thalassobacillus pellis]MBM7553869.1 hypothetical protein [Thalassobacillus pellis]